MIQDMNHTFVKALRTVFVAAMMLLTGTIALAQTQGVKVNGSVYGGGNAASVGATGQNTSATVNITSANAKVWGSVYGGCNSEGSIIGKAIVTITAGTIGTEAAENADPKNIVFGGGKGQATLVEGDVEVNIGTSDQTSGGATINGSVYGGSALGNVNAKLEGSPAVLTAVDGSKTDVNINIGEIKGDIYGGGLGYIHAENENESNDVAANVYGDVTVNIGAAAVAPATEPKGSATIRGSVFGCNNVNGTPQADVKVNIYQTAHTNDNKYPTTTPSQSQLASSNDALYAIKAVYGGGNKATYSPSADHSTTVRVYGCTENTVKTVYGGGNAADVGIENGTLANTNVIIDGGRFYQVFGGGNGAGTNNPGANIYGIATTNIKGGLLNQVFGGSDTNGDVNVIALSVDNQCGNLLVNESFGGANKSRISGNITTTLTCDAQTSVANFYGGSNQADITGNVTLNVEGGTYTNVFGGSKGLANQPANITGNVTLNLYGGTITNAFGGSDVNGNITGKITVNVEDANSATCPLTLENVYGGGQDAFYKPTTAGAYPEVNIKNGTVSGNVFGGGLGATAKVYSNPVVTIGDVTEGHESYVATVTGNVYGGGSAAMVGDDETATASTNNTTVLIQKANSEVAKVFGGGAAAGVTGTTSVTIANGLVSAGVYGGCDASGTVVGNITVNANGGTIGTNDAKTDDGVFGGGYGSDTRTNGNVTVAINGSTIYGDVYGGSALGNVNDASTDATTVTLASGTIDGNIYGGGLGQVAVSVEDDPATTDVDESEQSQAAIAALVNGAVTVTVNGGTVTDVFGCNNVNGSPQSTVTVDINNNVDGNVYGGGNLAAYSAPEGTPNYPAVNVNHGTVTTSVYGGGKGSTAVVTGNPVVTIGDNNNEHYAIVKENVYGGGDAAAVTGNTSVTYNDSHASSTVANLFGGGNAARVSGTSTVTLTNGKVTAGVYGGCNASGSVGNVTIALNGGNVGASGSGNEADVYGGGLGSSTSTTGNIGVTLNGTTVYGDIYGGSALGQVNASTSNTTTLTISSNTLHGTIYGGGKGSNDDEGTTATSNGNVQIDYNTANDALAGLYGGANINGLVKGNIIVNINANVGATGANNNRDIFGGGYGANTNTEGNVTVNIGDAAGTYTPVIYGDIYGGSALGNVNKDANNTTTVNFLNGTLKKTTVENVDYGGNIYGGGLGQKAPTAIAAKVNGQVVVNISNSSQDPANCKIDLRDANIYGCNNTNGSPQGNVFVNVYKTKHTEKDAATYTESDATYAISQVFGGGNQADYSPASGKKTSVHVYGCENTIQRVFGGGNAAAALGVGNEIDGGRFDEVYGGGNGESQPADIGEGGTDLKIHGGNITTLFGGSNTSGTIAGSLGISIDATGACASDMYIDEFFCGNNLADIGTSTNPVNINATIGCGTHFGDIYGGCNLADIYGNITLTIEGGEMNNVYGGSKGRAGDDPKAADINGNVTLNIYGGNIREDAFGGSNINGNITGSITVNMDWSQAASGCNSESDLHVGNIYGASNLATYTPTDANGNYPEVNIKHGTVSECVYGGGKGDANDAAKGVVTSNPKVTIGDDVEEHYAIVTENVYGGGDAAGVTGNTTVIYNDANTSSRVTKLFGGGNAAGVSGTANVTLTAGSVTSGVYGGCNASGATGAVVVNVTGGTIGAGSISDAGVISYTTAKANVHGGGLGQDTRVDGDVTVNIGQGTTGTAVIWGDVYGGSAKGKVNGTSVDSNTHTTQVKLVKGTIYGDLYGGGLGEDNDGTENDHAADVYGNVAVEVTGGTVSNIFGCNNIIGAPQQTVAVTINSGSNALSVKNVYGGGNAAAYTAPTATPNYPAVTLTSGTIGVNAYGGGLGSTATVTGNPQVSLAGATVSGNVFGGGSEAPVVGNPTVAVSGGSAANVFAGGDAALVTGNTTVTTTGGTVSQDLYGGGNLANVTGDVTVNIQGGTVTGDVYGGGAKAHTNTANWNDASGTWADSGITTTTESGVTTKTTTHKTIVNLTGGTIGNAYGGGLGAAGYPAYVYGDVEVKLGSETTPATATAFIYATVKTGEGDDAEEVTTKGRLFGCNNVNGSPKGNVTVTVRKTQGVDGEGNLIEKVAAEDKGSRYDLEAVYGGGNMAAYIPADPMAQRTKVDIYGCDDTSIRYVYGGGNSAPVPSTEVTVYSAYDLGYTFGGGNGSEKMWNGSEYVESPGADVGIIDRNAYNADHTTGTYGTGNAHSCLKGGTIHSTFGGSNTKGTIAGNTIPDILPDASQNCPLTIVNVYGGGKSADVDGDVDFTVSCLVDNITNVYGGSYDANIKGNVNLTVTSGVLNKVFGGNDHGGRIDGKIVVNIEEVDDCKPIKIKELYGGGNYADYPGKNFLTDTWFEKVKSGGENYPPSVTVNVKSCTWIRNIYGGGSDANVYGDVEVNIDMVKGRWAGQTYSPSYGAAFDLFDGNEPGSGDPEAIPNAIGKIGNVYGGGKNGNIYYSDKTNKTHGNVTVNIGTLPEISFATAPSHLTANANGNYDVEGAHIYGDVYGGGYGSETSVDGKVTVNLGATDISYTPQVDGDVYGGSALGKVDDTEVNLVKVSTHNVFGGGKGQLASGTLEAVSASVTGTSTVNMQGATVANIYGGCNYNGTSGNTALNIYGGQIGEGTLNLTATPKVFTRTTKGNVFGGGYGKDTYVAGNVEVNIGTSSAGNAVIFGDVYGGGALGHVNAEKPTGSTPIPYTSGKTTTVNLNNGTIFGDAYGGGLGQKTGFNGATVNHAAFVGGDVVVNVNGAAFIIDYENTNDKDPKDNTKWIQALTSGRVFGCNNLNGYPLGDVTVTVNKTVKGNVERSSTASKTNDNATYEIAAVYGGGNLADYTPTKTGAKPYVIINDCDVSIKQVYGGGNAAEVPGTDVDVRGAYEIHQVFGGGNGADKYKDDNDWQPNPGANVNGSPNTLLKGGVIHEAYGGSNEKGITGTISIKMVDGGLASCPLDLGKMVVAGKNADTFGDVKAVMDCNPSSKTPLIYFGADNANVWGNVEMTITSGNFGKVFAGNNLGGAIFGHVILNIEETGNCPTPITIDELYLGGNQASYSIYGYYREQTGTDGDNNPIYVYKPRTSATDAREPYYLIDKDTKTVGVYSNIADFPGYAEPVLNVISATRIDEVFGGGYGEGGDMYANPTVNINMVPGSHAATAITRTALNGVADNHRLGTIGNVYGGGNAAVVYGNTTVNIGTESKVYMVTEPVHLRANSSTPMTPVASGVNKDLYEVSTEGAYITGNVYGGGKLADVTGNTFVNICAKKSGDDYVSVGISDDNYEGVTIGENGVNDANHGNVFGGGKGLADNFLCDKAMVGEDGKGVDSDFNDDLNYLNGNTSVIIGNGTINGNVYGGGEIGRVEKNTTVTIGIGDGDANKTSAPIIRGDVFGGGKGDKEHGYAALVRGNPTVIVQGDAKVGHSVYGAGEIASVARYRVPKDENEVNAAIAAGYKDAKLGMPYALANTTTHRSGYCTVKVQGNAEIGPDGMQMTKAGGPDDAGHVFAAGKGFLPEGNWGYNENDKTTMPRRMVLYDAAKFTDANQKFWEYVDPTDANNKNVWEYFPSRAKYIEFIQTQALASNTEVTIGDDNGATPFIKGSVYGGSENGLVQFDTKVYIKGGQIGVGKNTTERHPDAVWADNYDPSTGPDLECASWEYKAPYAPYDPYAKHKNATDGKYYYDDTYTKSAEGGAIIATDGHTYYGNVFGGGSGSVPYFDTTEGNSKYLNTAGTVKGNTTVEISGGHILTNVYGGCEATNVLGKATIKMTKGTIGVPRTKNQIIAHPVTCYLFGAGKGDQRAFFNKDTNVENVEIEVSGGRIYGSVFGGGEDGHVMRDVKVTIGQEGGNGPKIGTLGSTYVDGNVFGGGRGFGGEALTAGNVGGTVDLIINGGDMLGSVYGGGRLASVGYGLYLVDEVVGGIKPYGVMRPDNVDDKGNTVDNFKRGYITVTVNGGTIGKEFADDAEGEHSGNVFGGSMGRLTKLDGSSFDDPKHWTLLATAKSTTVNINGGIIKRSVYGGGEMGTVTTNATVNVSGGTIGTSGKGGAEFGNVYGGGKGYVDPAGSNYVTAGIIKGNTTVAVSGTPQILHNVYGGGAYGSVGEFNYDATTGMPTSRKENTTGGIAIITITGGTIGTDGKENGMIFGSSRGDVGAPGEIHDKLAWVYDANVTIGTSGQGTTLTTPLVKGSVYGSGENGHTFNDAKVTVHSGTIGITDTSVDDGAAYTFRGNVYGGGCGTDKYDSDGNGSLDAYNPLAGVVYGNATVTIDGGQVVRNVYGAGAMGSVGKTVTTGGVSKTTGGLATISISGGQIGVDGTAGDGNVFGAARGDAEAKSNEFALVRKETSVSVTGGNVMGNVYGGGELGCVGTYTMSDDMRTFTWQDTEGATNTADNSKNTGVCNVTINGSSAVVKGNVFGAGKGKDDTFWCEKGIAYSTDVSVINGTVNGNVYGGGEVGRVETDAEVKIGIAQGEGKSEPTINGSVFGGGAGVETHGYSALVRGNTKVTIDQYAHVGHSVYGGGEIASVGKYGLDEHKMPSILQGGGYCYVTVKGNAAIADDVYGAGKGVTPHFDKDNTDPSKRSRRMTLKNGWESLAGDDRFDWDYFQTESDYSTYLETLALATHPEVTIDESANISGSVFGGGELGLTKGSVIVTIKGGTIAEDVYGGGSLANTNTTSTVDLDGDGKTETVHPTTKVSLLGGTIEGDAYGGGLGRKEYGTKGQAGYESPVEATVFGDVLVELNNNNNGGDADGSKKGCAVTRVFGCNNLNGTPKGKVKVYVYATQKKGEANLSTKAAKNTNTYDVQAVYGGGNLAPYIPVDATLDYATNQAKVDAARPEVYIDGCDLTSIKQVYGGGNAAPVPATYVEVNRAYEIDEAFGGGNGYDNYSLKEGDATVWYQNPGANVGYYTYASYPKSGTDAGAGTEESPWTSVEWEKFAGGAEHKDARLATNDPDAAAIRYGSGIATLVVKGGTIHTSYGGSNSKGNVREKLSSTYTASFDDCRMAVAQSYGGGKNAYSDADADMSADCAKGVKEMFGGSKDADFNGNINMLITNGSSLERVFGGNNTSGAVNGSITITLKEGGCEPIRIGELYLGGFLAPYSVYGYERNSDGTYKTEDVEYIDTDGTTKTKTQRIPIEGGTRLNPDPRINVISATYIGNIFGGGYQAKLVGNPHINVNMESGRILNGNFDQTTFVGEHKDANNNVIYVGKEIDTQTGDGILEIGTIGNIYGGGNLADVVGDTYVEIGTGTVHNDNGELVPITPARNAATITGNVFGGGKGAADSFECAKAMIGVDGESEDENKRDGGTHVIIGNGTVKGNVYGGGEIGRVERNTEVTIGLGDGVEGGTKSPIIEGNVFGAGSGKRTHGYSALVRGNSTVTVQGNAWVMKSVYGGGEIATVGKYKVNDAGIPTIPQRGGVCTVTVKGWAEVGPDDMQMKKAGGPDDTGYVFGACKGVLPYDGYSDSEKPQHMDGDRQPDGSWVDHPREYKAFNELTVDGNGVLEVDENYLTFINTLALATKTEVTIGDHAFIKGAVYGGSENGHVQSNTHVTIDDDCQIGNGDGMNRRYTDDEWAYDGSSDAKSLKECASWDYGKKIGTDANGKDIMEYLPYDVYKDSDNDGTPDYASDGHTFYGNVFGGGSGYFPYHRNNATALAALKAKDTGYADGLWHREAGSVGGNTVVDIKGGHILTSVYGGNECTDVTGTTTINMSGGTLGVPRTVAQIQAHPVTCYLFGAGKGDQRINFNTWTNVEKAIVNITGGHIFGSVFGGGEDGHVLGDVEMKISGDNTVIGTTGTSYVDGNIFGGGRGFSGDAQTAGTVGGNIKINIENGKMLGSVYGGGRLASVGTLFTAPDDPNYGNFVEDAGGKTYGHVTINISGGTIGNGTGNSVIGDVSGNVFGGSMGRLTLLNGGTNPIWPKMAQVKTTEVNISGNALIKRTVYGGGELGTVRDNTHVTISGGQVNRDVYGGGYGSEDDDLHTIFTVKEPKEGVTNPSSASDYDDNTYAFTPMQFAGCVGKSTTVDISGGYIRKSVYGGGEMASVGIMNCLVEEVTSEPGKDKIVVGKDNGKWTIYKNMRKHWDVDKEFALSWPIEFSYVPTFDGATHINITGGRIGTTTADDYGTDNGDVYGGGKGFAGDYNDYVFCANVGSTDVNINYASAATTLDPAAYMSGGDCIAGAVYGGGENGHVMGDTHVTLTNGLIGHALYGGGSGKGQFTVKLKNIGAPASSTIESNPDDFHDATIYSILAGKVFGNTKVDMSGGYVVRNVYGGGTMGSVGKGNYAGGTDDYSTTGYGENAGGNLWTSSADGDNAWQFLNSGICTVNITGGTVGYTGTKDGLPYGNVFGGCRGEAAPNIVETPRYLYSPEFFVGYANETRVTIGAEGSTTGPRILGSVYGGGQDGHVRRDAKVTINSGEIGSTYTGDGTDLNNIEWLHSGNVYGAGSGIGKYQFDFNHDGDFDDVVDYNNGRSTVATKETDYSTSAGSVTRSTKVEVKGGTIHRDVYGGGSLSSIGAPKIPVNGVMPSDPYHPNRSTEVGKLSLNEVIISGGTIGDVDGVANGYGGDVNGGSRGDFALGNSFSTSIWTDVTISGSADIKGNVFGGGEAGLVKQDTEVKMQGGTVGNDLYGAGDMADVNGNTKVLLTGGTVTRDVFGGARGTATIAANVGGDVLVDLNGGVDPANKGAVVKRNIFGANNVNGTPQGHVLVYVHGTQNENTAAINAKVDGQYDVVGVYGGGNQSDYVPTDTKQSTEVIIEGCDLTSIDEVYGGGYGAATPATSVLVKGTKIINNVYGGGYGASTDTYTNPGANVGYRSDKALYDQGTGKAIVQLMAGTINNVYGGSNTLGDIRGGSSVTNVANDGSAGCCEKLTVGEIYGGGKQADMYGGAEIVLGCMPNDWIGAIYAGAENADIGGDVGLTLTSGKFERVFGGNNKGGKIDGYIEVNIEENPDCGTPIIIGELYGGGNMAPYTIPAKYTENNPDYLSPRVNVRAFTSIGNIYGGGLGANATVTGNPLVNINEVAGGKVFAGETRTLDDGTKVTLYERKADGKMGVIGNVFGGGNAAPVIGNPRVEIGTAAKQKMLSLQTKDADGTIHEVEKDVLGADIRGNVYGGGNNATVTGDPKVVIGQRKD